MDLRNHKRNGDYEMAFIDIGYTISYWKNFFSFIIPSKPLPPPVLLSKVEEIKPTPIILPTTSTWDTFNPELIIEDKEFLDCDSMSEKQIQDLLKGRSSTGNGGNLKQMTGNPVYDVPNTAWNNVYGNKGTLNNDQLMQQIMQILSGI